MNAGKIESLLAELRKQRTAIDRAIEALEGVVGGEVPSPDELPTGEPEELGRGVSSNEIPRNAFYGMTIPDAVVHYLKVSKRKQTAREIYKAVKAGGIHTKSKNLYSGVYTALVRLEKAGQVGKFGREWGLAEWFPSATRKRSKHEKSANGVEEPDA